MTTPEELRAMAVRASLVSASCDIAVGGNPNVVPDMQAFLEVATPVRWLQLIDGLMEAEAQFLYWERYYLGEAETFDKAHANREAADRCRAALEGRG
jgi:hypothetical protein